MPTDSILQRHPHTMRGPATAMMDELALIQNHCQSLSEKHRRAIPAQMVKHRMHELARSSGRVLHDRVIEICFLIDQYGSLRFNQLRRRLGPVSTRTLSSKLALLQEKGLVKRIDLNTNPPRVDYQLTVQGKQLTNLLFPTLIHISQLGGSSE